MKHGQCLSLTGVRCGTGGGRGASRNSATAVWLHSLPSQAGHACRQTRVQVPAEGLPALGPRASAAISPHVRALCGADDAPGTPRLAILNRMCSNREKRAPCLGSQIRAGPRPGPGGSPRGRRLVPSNRHRLWTRGGESHGPSGTNFRTTGALIKMNHLLKKDLSQDDATEEVVWSLGAQATRACLRQEL